MNLLCFLYMQVGWPMIEHGVLYAKKALEIGFTVNATNFANNLFAYAANSPHMTELALELLDAPLSAPSGPDLAAQGWNLVAQGRTEDGLRVLSLKPQLFPQSAEAWRSVVGAAEQHAAQLNMILRSAQAMRDEVARVAAESSHAIQKSREDLETSANQAGLLVTSVNADATRQFFDDDAQRNEAESKSAWAWGLRVLGTAAAVAVLPLALHYVGAGPAYSTGALLGAHAASTGALATVAGVLLARARSRDVARQRANDLSTAMGTMIAYSTRIQDDGEKERFLMVMGQLVLQAHLTTGSSGGSREETLPGLVSLASALRDPRPGTPAAPSSGSESM